MTREQFAAALDGLGISKAEFARRLSALSGLKVHASHISRMCSNAATGRDPSPAAVVAVRLMADQVELERLSRAVERAGWTRKG